MVERIKLRLQLITLKEQNEKIKQDILEKIKTIRLFNQELIELFNKLEDNEKELRLY
jgi:hypothetical protein